MNTEASKRSLGLTTVAWQAAWFAAVAIPAAVLTYYWMLAGFTEYDDEGAMMLSVKQYLGGARLYRDIYSGYGPVYYFYNWFVRSITGTAVDHNATRVTSAVVWLLCSLLCAWIVYRLTKSLPLASIAHVLVFSEFRFFRSEPGHPQELCMLLLLCLVAGGRHPRLGMVWVGALVAALAMVKVNIGIFVILAAGLAMAFQLPAGRWVRAARFALGLAALALPAVLMKVHLGDPLFQPYCAVVTFSVAALLATLRSADAPHLSARDFWIAAAACAVTGALCVLVVRFQGASFSDILWSLVLQHVRVNVQQPFWYLPLLVRQRWIGWALLGLAAAAFAGKKTAIRDRLLPPAKLWFGLVAMGLAWADPTSLIGFVTPLCWLVILPPSEEVALSFPRILLCAATVLQTLYAYPLAGSQAIFIQVLPTLVGAIAFADALPWLLAKVDLGSLRFLRPALAAAALLAAPVFNCVQAYGARQDYLSYTPLPLPGAEKIRLPDFQSDQVRDYPWLVHALRQSCDAFVGYPGLPSLQLWSGVPAPGLLNMDDWMQALNTEQQELIVQDFARFPRACVVFNPRLAGFWNRSGQDWDDLPLVRYIARNFKQAGQIDDYTFLIRKEQP